MIIIGSVKLYRPWATPPLRRCYTIFLLTVSFGLFFIPFRKFKTPFFFRQFWFNFRVGTARLEAPVHAETVQVAVTSEGFVRLESPLIHLTMCPVSLTQFPYDSQECILMLIPRGPFVFIPSEAENIETVSPQWRVTGISHQVFSEIDTWTNTEQSILIVSIVLERLPNFYLRNIMCPLVLMNALAMSTFFIPLKSGERISACLALVLGVTVFQIVIADIMPKTSQPGEEPQIIGYGVSSFILLVSVTIEAILATNVSFKNWKIKTPFLRWFLLDFFASIMLMKRFSGCEYKN